MLITRSMPEWISSCGGRTWNSIKTGQCRTLYLWQVEDVMCQLMGQQRCFCCLQANWILTTWWVIISMKIHIVIVRHGSNTPLKYTGAVALENVYPSSNHRFINTEVNCSGLELKITNCIQNLDEAYSCLSFGIASVSCHSMFCNCKYFFQLKAIPSSYFILVCSWNSS